MKFAVIGLFALLGVRTAPNSEIASLEEVLAAEEKQLAIGADAKPLPCRLG
jgi:hypothetical protein